MEEHSKSETALYPFIDLIAKTPVLPHPKAVAFLLL